MSTPVLSNDSHGGQFATTTSPKQPVLPCNSQANKNKPCDVTKLQLQSGSTTATAQWRVDNADKRTDASDGRTKIKDADKRKIADAHDLILEIASAYPESTSKFDLAKVPKVTATSTYAPASCPVKQHPHVYLAYGQTSATDSYNKPPQSTEYTTAVVPNLQFCGPEMEVDSTGTNFWLKVISLFPKSNYSRDITISADSCGVRLPDANKSLSGLLRVFRADPISLTVTFPSMMGGAQSTTNKAASTAAKTIGGGEYKESYDKAGKLTSLSESSSPHGIIKSKYSLFATPDGSVVAADTKSMACTISVKRGGAELSLTEIINRWFSALETLAGGIDRFMAALKSLPKVGYWVEGSWELISGNISGSWGLVHDPEQSSDAYQLLKNSGSITFGVTLAKGSITGGVGIKVDSPEILDWITSLGFAKAYRGELNLQFTSNGSVAVNFTVDLGARDFNTTKELVESPAVYSWEVKFTAALEVIGVGAEFVAKLTGGVTATAWLRRYQTATGGSLDLELRVEFQPIRVTVMYRRLRGSGDEATSFSPLWTKDILDKLTIYGDADNPKSGKRILGHGGA